MTEAMPPYGGKPDRVSRLTALRAVRSLRVIQQWAQYDIDNIHGPRALRPDFVKDLCERTLGENGTS